MRRAGWLLALMILLVVGTSPIRGDSTPKIQGGVLAWELCPQSVCHVAIFAGLFRGQVGVNRNAIGTVAVAVNHDPLPDPDQCVAITDGRWSLWVGLRQFGGGTTGMLCGNDDNTFDLLIDMTLNQGGVGTLSFTGLLDHNTFPPTVTGAITQ